MHFEKGHGTLLLFPMSINFIPPLQEEYPERFFPPFVHGPAYIVGREAAKELLNFVPYVPFVKLEDVYVTGLVAHAAKIKHVQIFNEVSSCTKYIVMATLIIINVLKTSLCSGFWAY